MNVMALNNVYNNYLTSYAPKGTTSFDTHKKSELRSVYNSIVKLNKESPLYLMNATKDTQAFAVGIKEGARNLRNTIASLGGLDEDSILDKKIAFSSNEDIASATYIGDAEDSDSVPSLEIEVRNLASPQVNTGRFLPSNSMELPADSYSFDVGINDLNYEFQFIINSGDTNKDLQDRLARLINNADIGIDATTLEDAQGNSSLRLQSTSTGLQHGKDVIFTISDDKTSKASGTVSYLGLDDVTRPAQNSNFLLNGQERETAANNFTIEKTYEVELKGLSSTEGETASIGLKNDTESFNENINYLVGSYNDFLRAASEHLTSQSRNSTLISEMNRITSYYKEDFDEIGLQIQEDGSIQVDPDKLNATASATGVDIREQFSPIKNFTNSVVRKTNEISLNPMHYVSKTVVAYKNPGKNFANPYATSAYSGMMFNSYC
ncbi:MAG: flagellar capping protein [Lachnospiraceae bacterium]|nr:flagellar capping protein [Lachnospiraceae bacterium]